MDARWAAVPLGLAGLALTILIAAWPCRELIESVRGHEGWVIYGW